MDEIRGITLTGVVAESRGPLTTVVVTPEELDGERVLGSVGRDEDGNTVLVVQGHVVVSATDDCLVVCWPQG